MNWIYTGVYFVDLVRLALVMCGIFGFSFSLNSGLMLVVESIISTIPKQEMEQLFIQMQSL